MYGRSSPWGARAMGGGRFFLHKLNPERFVSLVLGDHTDLGVNPSPATS